MQRRQTHREKAMWWQRQRLQWRACELRNTKRCWEPPEAPSPRALQGGSMSRLIPWFQNSSLQNRDKTSLLSEAASFVVPCYAALANWANQGLLPGGDWQEFPSRSIGQARQGHASRQGVGTATLLHAWGIGESPGTNRAKSKTEGVLARSPLDSRRRHSHHYPWNRVFLELCSGQPVQSSAAAWRLEGDLWASVLLGFVRVKYVFLGLAQDLSQLLTFPFWLYKREALQSRTHFGNRVTEHESLRWAVTVSASCPASLIYQQAQWPAARDFTSPNSSFLICKMGYFLPSW